MDDPAAERPAGVANTAAAAAEPGREAVTTWYLEQTARGDLRPAAVPGPAAGVAVVRAQVPSGEFLRYLYTSVGADVSWVDRLPWSGGQWQARAEQPGCELWVAYEHGTPAGFVELAAEPGTGPGTAPAAGPGTGSTAGPGAEDGAARTDAAGGARPRSRGSVEIAYFGLLPAFRGRGIGGHLLSYGAARAWDLAARWPGRPATDRVWLHTCSLDGPYALGNYRCRGFRVTNATVSHSAG